MFPKVVQVIPKKDYSVYVYFEDGKIVCYDMNRMLEKEAFQPLKDINVFMDTCTVLNDRERSVSNLKGYKCFYRYLYGTE